MAARRRSGFAASVSVLALTVACVGQHPKSRPPPTGAEIIGGMVHAYEQASSDEDSGTVTTQFIGAHTRKASFTTVFVRSEGIRFDFRDEFHPKSVVWTSRDKVQSYDAGGSIEGRSNLGRTRKYSEVPGLLLPTVRSGPGLAEMKDVRLAPVTEPIDGHPCCRVTGRHPRLEDLTLWIDQSTHVLRRSISREHYEGPSSTTRRPRRADDEPPQ